MHQTSGIWEELRMDPNHWEETRLSVAGVDYLEKNIVEDSLKVTGGMFQELDIGNCASRQMDVTLLPISSIPKQAEIVIYKRLVNAEKASEWVRQGVFFISTRKEDKLTKALTIHAFDAMRKAGDIWLTEDNSDLNWPMTEREAAENIAGRMGINLDPRTKLNNAFSVDFPVDENGDLTMAEVLSGIAVANAGNWIITDDGDLLLRRLGEEPEETFYLVTEHGNPIEIGGLLIYGG